MWVDADDDQLLINTEIHRAKYKAIQQHPEVTVTIWDHANPYRYAEVRGRVSGEVRGDQASSTSTPSPSATSATTTAPRSRASASCCASARSASARAACEHPASQGRRRDGFGQRLVDDARRGRGPRAVRRAARGQGRQRPPDARRDVRLRRGRPGPRHPGDHRRRRRRRPPARDARRQDDASRARRAGAVAPPAGPGLAAVDRPDAGRHPGRHVRHRRGRRHQRRAVRGRPAGRRRPVAGRRPRRRPGRPPRPGGVVDPAASPRDPDRPAGDHRRARRRPARALHRRRRPPDGLRDGRARPRPAAPAGAVADVHLVAPYDDPDCPRPPGRGVRGRHDRVREPAGRGAGAPRRRRRRRPVAGRRRHRPGPHGREVVPAPTRGVPTAPWSTGDPVGYPAIVKTARLGYDGKGQVAVADDAELAAALERLAVPCVVERRVPLDVELSVLVARTADGRHVDVPGRREPPRRRASSTSPSCRPGSLRTSPAEAQALALGDRRGARLRRRAGRRAVRQRRPAARQRAGAAPPQQRALDARRVGDEPVRAAGAGGVRAGPRADRARRRDGGGDGQPARRPLGRRRRRRGTRRSPTRPPTSTSTASGRPGRVARWATSRCSATTRRPAVRCAARRRSHADADELADRERHGARDDDDHHLAQRRADDRTGGEPPDRRPDERPRRRRRSPPR